MGRMKELAWKRTSSPVYTQIVLHKDKWMTSLLLAFIELTRETFKTKN